MAQKISVYEWYVEENSNRLRLRTIAKNVKILYKKELDAYYIKYKNAVVPVKHDYIIDNIFNVINHENSFVPFKQVDTEILKIDAISSGERAEKINQLIAQAKDPKEFEPPTDGDPKKIDAYNTNMKLVEALKNEGILKTVVKFSAIPMEIRSWFITNQKKIMERRSTFLERFGWVLWILFFAIFSISMVYVAFDQVGKLSHTVAQDTANAIAGLLKINATVSGSQISGTVTGTLPATPP